LNPNTLSSLIGGALGDALGYSREFNKIDQILKALPDPDEDYAWRYATFDNAPNSKACRDADGKVLISDDTQMTIATGRALLTLDRVTPSPKDAAEALSNAYSKWSVHPDNQRAPGGACMRACSNLRAGLAWEDATGMDAMGCGANMRVAPIALNTVMGPHTARGLAHLSSAITHAHPGALAATALTADAIRAAALGIKGRDLLDYLISHCRPELNTNYPAWVLGDLWSQSKFGTPESYMQAGYTICARLLYKVEAALNDGWDGQTDPCTITGEAWTAPEAFAGAVLCTVGLWDDPMAVLQRAACSNGDSDSLAAIAGNIRGAAGVEWPESWVSELETKPVLELQKIAREL
jgi:ADP-ribosylglycohydrolase